MNGTCKTCGREFFKNHTDQEYCSKKCIHVSFMNNNPDYYREYRKRKKPILTKQCRHCDKMFETTSSLRIFCSNECKIAHHNAMRKTTKEQLRECPICKKVFRPMQKTGVGRTYCTPECRNKAMNQKRTSAKSKPSWKDQTKKWKGNWYKALKRDNFMCQICGKSRKPGETTTDKKYALQVHHWDGEGTGRGKNHDINNLVTLCEKCHRDFHTQVHLVRINGEYFVRGNIFAKLGITEIKTINS